ncbi:MFS transporter [Saccharolobus islandicus]|uniref:Permeases of the major facilitator superfamily n=3 Tax=Saccharolobus islandicus TaxID=43080 RepID=M9UI42_SACIS|nr:MFS transporter [Sulfolobus islandicus]ADX83877.1 major facilitator superfamily MFS_1 [Sulfolobus islandicus HVE10/4]AGJ63870.1 Permeases of the major facilitator superfamily [Sulfolobus islandicus LAL14/1]
MKGNLRWKIVLIVFALIIIDYIDRGLINTALPVLKSEFHISSFEAGVIGDGFTFGYLIMNPVVGYFLDKYGPKRVFGRFAILWGAVQAINVFAFSTLYFIVTRILLGIGEAVGFPGVTKITANWLRKDEKARGGTISDSGVNLGIVFGSLFMLGLFAIIPNQDLAWRLGFLISGLLAIILAIILGRLLYDLPEQHPKISKEELDYILSGRENVSMKTKLSLSYWLRSKNYWGYMQGLGAQAGIFFGLFTWLPLYLFYARHLSLAFTLEYTALIWSFGFIGEVVGGYVVDKLIKRNPNLGFKVGFAISSLSVTIGLAAATLVSSPIEAVEILMVTFFFLRWSGIQWAAPSFLVQPELAGQFGGHIGFWETLWGIVVPIVFGATVEATKEYLLGMEILIGIGLIYFIGTVLVTTYRQIKVN